jgi:hypothetical protein
LDLVLLQEELLSQRVFPPDMEILGIIPWTKAGLLYQETFSAKKGKNYSHFIAS